MTQTLESEVDRNYEAFLKLLPSIEETHRDKFALMKNKKILGYYSSAEDALEAAKFIADGVYSIQQVTVAPINLGFFNYAVPVD